MNETFTIQFEEESLAEAGIQAGILKDTILDETSDIDIKLEKTDPTTQDAGNILVLLLGTPALVAVAGGIARYLSTGHAKIKIYDKTGGLIADASGLRGQDAAHIAEVLSKSVK